MLVDPKAADGRGSAESRLATHFDHCAIQATLALLVAAASMGAAACRPTEPSKPSARADPSNTGHVSNLSASIDRRWFLRGDGLSVGDHHIIVRIEASGGLNSAWTRVNDRGPWLPATRSGSQWQALVPLENLAPGSHMIHVTTRPDRSSEFSLPFRITAPLYAVVSIDWCDSQVTDRDLAAIENLRKAHPTLIYSHLYSPFHFTDPRHTPARRQALEQWIKTQQERHHDEIGVHIHAWCPMVEAAGVRCRTTPAYGPENEAGRQTILAYYSEDEMRAMLRYSRREFTKAGLGRPTSFRAGGWTTGPSTLRALAAEGFLVEASGLPAEFIRAEWERWPLYSWNAQNWAGITPVSQPYYPSASNHRTDALEPHLDVLEVPDNGCLVDYMTVEQMREVYERNSPSGTTLNRSTLYQIGFHAPGFGGEDLARMDQALTHVDAHAYASDAGPAIYVRLSDLPKVWPANAKP